MEKDSQVAKNIVSWNRSLDLLRGIAILAVVFGYANTGVVSSGLVSDQNRSVYSLLNVILYCLHILLFAFLFGINMPEAWEKRKHPQYMVSRIFLFLWLYLIWTMIQGGFEVLGSRFQNGEGTSIWDVLNLWHPIAHLWFLPWAAIASALILGTRPWRNKIIAFLLLVLSAVLAILMWGSAGSSIFYRGMALIFFAILGCLVGETQFRTLTESTSILKFLVGLLASAGMALMFINSARITPPSSGDPYRTSESILNGAIVTCLGIIAIICIFSYVNKKIDLYFIEYLGKKSLQIYLVHLIFVPTTRVVLTKLGFNSPLIVDIFATFVGIFGSLLFYYVSRNKFSWLFGSPRFLSYKIN